MTPHANVSVNVTTPGVDDLLADPDRLLPAVIEHLEANHERSAQLYPGHSSLGRCRRAAAYGLAGVTVDEGWRRSGSIQAWIGTAVHQAFLPVLRRLLGPARTEMTTTWRPAGLPALTGHVDLYRRRSRLVLDLKTVSRHQLDLVRRTGARERDLLQVHANTASLRAEHHPVDVVGLLYVCTETSMDRADGDGALWLQPVDDALLAKVETWWGEVAAAGLGDPETAPRDERGPGLSWQCDACPWLRRCWGADAQPGEVGPQKRLVAERGAVTDALALLDDAQARYTEAGRAQRRADEDRNFAAAVLAETPEGNYQGDGVLYSLRWKPGKVYFDQAEAARLLSALNVEPPKATGRPKPVVSVTPYQPDAVEVVTAQ